MKLARKTSLGAKAVGVTAVAVGGYVAWNVLTGLLVPMAILGALGAGGYYLYKKI